MRHIADVPWTQRLMVLAALVVIALSAREAVAATTTLRQADCGVTNWCSLGQENCDDCCGGGVPPTGGGLCYSDDPGIQGCLCY